MTDLELLADRLQAVEKQYARIKRILMLAVVVIAAGGIMGQVRGAEPRRALPPLQEPERRVPNIRTTVEDQIRANQFILVDRNGKERATLVADGAGSVFLVMFDSNGKPRADLSVSNFGPSLTLSDASGQPRAVFGSTTLVGSRVVDNGVVERNPASSLVLFDRNGKILWRP